MSAGPGVSRDRYPSGALSTATRCSGARRSFLAIGLRPSLPGPIAGNDRWESRCPNARHTLKGKRRVSRLRGSEDADRLLPGGKPDRVLEPRFDAPQQRDVEGLLPVVDRAVMKVGRRECLSRAPGLRLHLREPHLLALGVGAVRPECNRLLLPLRTKSDGGEVSPGDVRPIEVDVETKSVPGCECLPRVAAATSDQKQKLRRIDLDRIKGRVQRVERCDSDLTAGIQPVYLADLPGHLGILDHVVAGERVDNLVQWLVLNLPRIEQRRGSIPRDARVEILAVSRSGLNRVDVRLLAGARPRRLMQLRKKEVARPYGQHDARVDRR